MERWVEVALDVLSEGVFVHDDGGNLVWCNGAAPKILGLSTDELLGRSVPDPRWRAFGPDGAPMHPADHPALIALRTGNAQRNVELIVSLPSGERRAITVSSVPFSAASGRGVVSTVVDRTPARRAADQLAARERELRLVADNSQDLVLRIGRDGIIDYASPASRDLVGRSPSEMAGLPLLSLVHADDHVGVGPLVHAVRAGHVGDGRLECRIVDTRGRSRWVEIVLRAEGEPALSPTDEGRLVVAVRNIDDRKLSDARRHDAQHLMDTVFEDSPNAIGFTTAAPGSGTAFGAPADASSAPFARVNRAFASMLGYTVEELRRTPLNRLFDAEDIEEVVETNRLLLEGYVVRDNGEVRMIKADGEPLWVALVRSVVTDSVGNPIYVLGHYDDITQEVPQSHPVAEPEVVDALTGLANRRMLDRVLARELDADAPMAAIVLCDVDGMRAVNEQLGHGTGDRVLREVASELRSSVRAGDLVARFGGDEFVVVVKGPRCAEVVDRLVDSFHDYTLSVGSDTFTVSISAGSAVGYAGQHVDDLLAQADQAMFTAKRRRRAEQLAPASRV